MSQEELLQLIEATAIAGTAELDLSGYNLTELPAEIGTLTQLKTLILGKYARDDEGKIVFHVYKWDYVPKIISNDLRALPKEIRQLSQLQELQIVGNQLSSLPPEIAQLSNLQTLNRC